VGVKGLSYGMDRPKLLILSDFDRPNARNMLKTKDRLQKNKPETKRRRKGVQSGFRESCDFDAK
jgi:hypothetical protein